MDTRGLRKSRGDLLLHGSPNSRSSVLIALNQAPRLRIRGGTDGMLHCSLRSGVPGGPAGVDAASCPAVACWRKDQLVVATFAQQAHQSVLPESPTIEPSRVVHAEPNG